MALIRKRLNSEIADPGNDYGTADLDATKGRQKPDTVIRKLFIRTFQCLPQKELTHQFRDFLATRELPPDDNSIRELLLMMMTSPNYQVT